MKELSEVTFMKERTKALNDTSRTVIRLFEQKVLV